MNLVKLIKLPRFDEDCGDLVVIEPKSNNIPFRIRRIFNVRSPKNSIRGKHAHRNCTQFLICANGSIEVKCDNGIEVQKFILNKSNLGLLVLPGVWAEQKYIQENTVLTVLCDQRYAEDDYIREYEEFINFVNS